MRICKEETCHNEVLKGYKYCSLVCSSTDRKKQKIVAWLNNPGSATTIEGVSDTVKNYLIDQAGNKCLECGWDEVNPYTGRVPLTIEHADGNCKNNAPENLKVLCPNCHALTPTYKALNRNNSRRRYS